MNSDAFHPVFFDTGRVVHLLDQHTEQTFCALAGRRCWKAHSLANTLETRYTPGRDLADWVKAHGPEAVA